MMIEFPPLKAYTVPSTFRTLGAMNRQCVNFSYFWLKWRLDTSCHIVFFLSTGHKTLHFIQIVSHLVSFGDILWNAMSYFLPKTRKIRICFQRKYNSLRKTHLFQYIENITTKKRKFSDKNFWYFSYFCSKHRSWVLIRTTSVRRF